LYRIWDKDKPLAMCIGLNPSTANGQSDDATIESLIRIFQNLDFGGFYMLNLFSLISPDPEALRMCPDPVNGMDRYIHLISGKVKVIVFCWGNFKQAEYRAVKMIRKFPTAVCFGKNKSGTPRHPLYLKATSTLIPFKS
jgi:hypothetical protein